LKNEDYLNDLRVNFLGAVNMMRQLVPLLKKGASPSVVFLSTVAVQTGLPFHASISAAKGAIEGFTRAMAAELAPAVRVNAIAPSLTDTPLAERLLSNDSKRESSADRHPLKRVGTTRDIASSIKFLLSPESSWITGQVLKVDGGLSVVK
jgi:NAD(P)-dependent dehydrogenase (short-subunit alcohol dehydrogenase family)